MFPGRFFPSRYFPDRYFAKTGSDPFPGPAPVYRPLAIYDGTDYRPLVAVYGQEEYRPVFVAIGEDYRPQNPGGEVN